jgi:nitrite reductase/ring-hydroxylating ferredoxin subunit
VGALSRSADRDPSGASSFFKTVLTIGLALLVSIGVACDGGARKRPIGYVRLGLAAELAQRPETFFSDARVFLRYEDGGFSAMSTACTHDLSALTRVSERGAKRWVSSYSSSSYDDRGRVLEGPARSNLPFYKVQLAAGTYGGVPDTLFVEIGVEIDSARRLSWSEAR